MPEQIDLKLCPICGSDDVEHRPYYSAGYDEHSACNDCGTEVPGNPTAWNRRTPEPATSVIRWTRYDGSAETLPEEDRPVLLAKAMVYGGHFFYWHSDDWAIFERWTRCVPELPRKVGDLWAYLPEPPEGMG